MVIVLLPKYLTVTNRHTTVEQILKQKLFVCKVLQCLMMVMGTTEDVIVDQQVINIEISIVLYGRNEKSCQTINNR